MISICDTLDKAIKFMELTIEYVSDPENEEEV